MIDDTKRLLTRAQGIYNKLQKYYPVGCKVRFINDVKQKGHVAKHTVVDGRGRLSIRLYNGDLLTDEHPAKWCVIPTGKRQVSDKALEALRQYRAKKLLEAEEKRKIEEEQKLKETEAKLQNALEDLAATRANGVVNYPRWRINDSLEEHQRRLVEYRAEMKNVPVQSQHSRYPAFDMEYVADFNDQLLKEKERNNMKDVKIEEGIVEVNGVNVNRMSTDELFTIAENLEYEIDKLEERNKLMKSEAVKERVKMLKGKLAKIIKLYDAAVEELNK